MPRDPQGVPSGVTGAKMTLEPLGAAPYHPAGGVPLPGCRSSLWPCRFLEEKDPRTQGCGFLGRCFLPCESAQLFWGLCAGKAQGIQQPWSLGSHKHWEEEGSGAWTKAGSPGSVEVGQVAALTPGGPRGTQVLFIDALEG